MTEEITKVPPDDPQSNNKTITDNNKASNDLLGSQRVYKKSSPNSMLTLYIPTRELVSRNGIVAPLKGVLHADPKLVQGHRIFGQLTLTFRYGREDEEVMGLRFCNEAVMSLAQIWPPPMDDCDKDSLTPLQDALIKRLGEGAHPFTLEITPQAPPSVQLVPAKRYYGAPIGTSYDVRCFVADRSDEKLHRRSTVRMGIRLIHKTDDTQGFKNVTSIGNPGLSNKQLPPSSSTSMTTGEPMPTPPPPLPTSARTKSERIDSFAKLKLSPKAFRFTGKLCRSKSEIEKGSSDYYDNFGREFESTRGPQGAVDKPFLLQEGKVGLRASLDKSVYAHGENVIVTVDVKNDSRKTVRRIWVTAIQHVDVCMFSNGKFKNIVAESDPNLSEVSVKTGSTLHKIYTLYPQRGPTKNWIALEDSLQRCNEPNAINALIATSALRSPPANIEERNVFAIYVSYYVKVKLALSVMGGELSLKLPFTLAHIDKPNSSDDNNILIVDQLKSNNLSDDKPLYNPMSPTSTTTTTSSTPTTSQASTTTATCDQNITGGAKGTSSSCSNGRDNSFGSGCSSGGGPSGIHLNHKKLLTSSTFSSTSSSSHSYHQHHSTSAQLAHSQQQHQQQLQTHTTNNTELIDKIEQISDDLVIERGNGSGKSIVMLKHTRRSSTIQISSVDEENDDSSVVGHMASDLLNGSDLDVRQTETTCVEVHASST